MDMVREAKRIELKAMKRYRRRRSKGPSSLRIECSVLGWYDLSVHLKHHFGILMEKTSQRFYCALASKTLLEDIHVVGVIFPKSTHDEVMGLRPFPTL